MRCAHKIDSWTVVTLCSRSEFAKEKMLSNSNVFILLILIKHSTLFGFTLANSVEINKRIDNKNNNSSSAIFDNTEIITAAAAEEVTTATTAKIQLNAIYGKLAAPHQVDEISNQKHYDETIATVEHSKTESKNSPNSASTSTSFPPTLPLSSSSTPSLPTYHAPAKHVVKTPNQIPLLHKTISKTVHNDSLKSVWPSSAVPTKVPTPNEEAAVNTQTSFTSSSPEEKTLVNLEPFSILKLSKSNCNNSNSIKSSVNVSTIDTDDGENGNASLPLSTLPKQNLIEHSSNGTNANTNYSSFTNASNKISSNINNKTKYNYDTTDSYNSNQNINVKTIKNVVHQTNFDGKSNNKSSSSSDNDDSNVVEIEVDDEDDDEQQQADEPIQSSQTNRMLDQWPDRSDALYFVVAVSGGEKIWSRTLARTLSEMGPPFSGGVNGPPLRPIYVDLPANGR